MKPFHIFVEGPTDEAFVKEALSRFGFDGGIAGRITTFKGWTKLSSPLVQKRLDAGDAVLIIFDADDPTKDAGGFENRLGALREELGDELFECVHVFLFPENGSDGDLENILSGMVPDRHQAIIDECWDGYTRCLVSKFYNPPTAKSKLHEYAAALDANVWKDQGFNKTFASETIWNWSACSVEPLRRFLTENLTD